MVDFSNPNSLTDAELTKILDFGDIVGAHVKACRAEAFKRANRKPGCIPGYKIAPGQTNRDWQNPDTVPTALKKIGVPDELIWRRSVASPAQTEAALKTVFKGKPDKLKEAMAELEKLIKKVSSGSQSLVRDIDPREEVKRGDEFKGKVEKYVKTANDADDLL